MILGGVIGGVIGSEMGKGRGKDAATLAGLGIALLPLVVCRSELRTGALRVVLDGVAPPPVPIHITYPSGRFLAPSVRVFVDHVRARFDLGMLSVERGFSSSQLTGHIAGTIHHRSIIRPIAPLL